MFEPDPAPLAVELLVLPETTLIQVAAVIEPMRAANRLLGRRQFAWTISTPDGAAAPTQAGIPVPAARAFDPLASREPLFVFASYNIDRHAAGTLIRRLGRAGRERPVIGGIEGGAWAVARAGLLTGRRATTHWEDLDAFAGTFPDIRVEPARFVIDGNRFTTGGAGPALDLMLALIRRRLGYPLALEVAKAFIYEPSGREEQAPALALARPREPVLASALSEMEANLDAPLPLERIARRAGVSARHLQTLFRRRFGVSPHGHYLALRLNHARRLLIETAQPVVEVAAAAGFASAASFTRAYRQMHGETPSQTRRAAGGHDIAPPASTSDD
ncbi:GlxA family transcriptional regulator [Limibaculum sp. M0105]|uniref:GlxA family transcriptional regulator n=1 Tax=Thermohalobaculum xanthum TaxID=2753746 RepID=A0A8J7M9I8_9RHOB|nr:helix-turn-helix domain-containing protein [Thermohalobaculum xanthum]MBK0400735.1 GlxA family transcriptional regulator [Thermohalobaculum xanthum]